MAAMRWLSPAIPLLTIIIIMDNKEILIVLALIFYSMLGVLYKMIIRKNCRIKNTLFIGFTCAAVLSAVVCLFFRFLFNPWVLLIGLIGGTSLYAAIYLYLKSLTLGKKVTSWVIFKMSLVVAVLVSVFLWGEKITSKQTIGIILMISSVIFFGLDMRIRKKDDVD